MTQTRLIQALSLHRRALWLAALTLLVIALFLAARGKYETRLDGIFAKGSLSQRTMALLQDSGLSDKLVVSIESDAPLTEAQVEWIDGLNRELKDMPQVQEALFRILPDDLGEAMEAIVPALPQLLPPPDFSNPQEVCGRTLRQLMTPAPGIAAFVRSDPYSLRNGLLERLQALRDASGVRFDESKSYLASEDQRHAAIRLTLDVSYDNTAETAPLLDEIAKFGASAQKEGLRLSAIGAAVHTLGNERVIRRDLQVIGWLSPIFLVALFLIVFRGDWRCVWIPMLPLGALLLSTGLLALFADSVQLFVLGIGGSILGLAVDQGIHVYLACKSPNRLENLSSLLRPLSLASGTSIVVFAMMLFLKSPALRHLGALAAMGLLFSLVATWLILPTLLPQSATMVQPADSQRRKGCGFPRGAALGTLAILIIAALVLCVKGLHFDFDVSRLDGAPKGVWKAEAEYAAVWTPKTPPILLVRHPESPEGRALLEALDDCHPVQCRDFWPEESNRLANLEKWRSIDLEAAEDALRLAAAEAGLNRQGRPDFFAPFFNGIRDGLANPPETPPSWLGMAFRQLLKGDVALVFLRETTGVQEALNASSADAALLSPQAFRNALAKDFGAQLMGLLPAACIAVMLLAACILRSWRSLLMAASTVVITLLLTCGALAAAGRPMTLMCAVTAMLLMGLSIDYGVFAAQWSRENFSPLSPTPSAMALSAATTVFTAALLLFSKHPVLFDIGFMLTVGISFAFILARFILPALCRRSVSVKALLLVSLAVGALGLNSCVATYPKRARMYPSEAMREIAAQPAPPEKICAKVTLHFLLWEFPMVVAGNADYSARVLKLVGMTAAGTELFHFEASPEAIISGEPSPLMPKFANGLFEAMACDLARTFLDNRPAALSPNYKWTRGSLRFTRRGQSYLFAGNPLSIWRKSAWKNGFCIWSLERLDDTARQWLFHDRDKHLKLEISIL